MKKLVKKVLAIVLAVTIVPSNSTFASKFDELNNKILESKEKLKDEAKHITVTDIKDNPDYRLELFRYTALEEIIPSLKFEKSPYDFVQNKYEKKFNIIEKCCTAIGTTLGAGLGLICGRILRNKDKQNLSKELSKENVDNNKQQTNKLFLKQINYFGLTCIVSLFAFVFGGLMKCTSGFYGLRFMRKERTKLEIEKSNALLAIKGLISSIEYNKWKFEDSILVQINSGEKYHTAVPTMVTCGIDYSEEEKTTFWRLLKSYLKI